MVFNTGSQKANLQGSPPIDKPRYTNGILPTLQFKIDHFLMPPTTIFVIEKIV